MTIFLGAIRAAIRSWFSGRNHAIGAGNLVPGGLALPGRAADGIAEVLASGAFW